VRAVVAGGDQSRVFDLLVAPQRRQRRAVARIQLLGEQADAVDIKQGAIGIEENGAWLFHTP